MPARPNHPAIAPPTSGRTVLLTALLLGGYCGTVYLLIAGRLGLDFRQTDFAHHVLMADAMLHGQLHIRDEVVEWMLRRNRPHAVKQLEWHLKQSGERMTEPQKRQWVTARVIHDWAIIEGRLYGYWSPLTPAVLVPWVALTGYQTSDFLINAVFGGLNVGLFYWLLRRVDRQRLCPTTEPCRIALTLLLAFGTVHFYLSCAGRVWFATQLVTLTAILAACIAACSSHPGYRRDLLSGMFFGAAMLGRTVVPALAPFFIMLIWIRSAQQVSRRIISFLFRSAWFLIPCVAAAGIHAAYNAARFGSVWDDGMGIQIRTGGDPRFLSDYKRYGHFDVHYLPTNLKYYLWNWRLDRQSGRRIWFDKYGNSMFVVTPPFLYMFLAWRRRTWFTLALLGGALPLMAALMLFRATGYYQFGNRYLLDIMPFLLLLVATGMRGRLTAPGYVLIVLAVTANAFGTYRFCDAQLEDLKPWVSGLTLPAFTVLAAVVGLVLLKTVGHRRRPVPGG